MVQCSLNQYFHEKPESHNAFTTIRGDCMNKFYVTIILFSLILLSVPQLSVPQVVPAVGPTDDPPAHLKPVAELLKPDGTLDLTTGFNGSLDVSGFRMETGLDGKPRFLPDLAGHSGSSPSGSVDLQGTRSDDDQFWASGFHLAGISDKVYALAVIGNDWYAAGEFTSAGETAAYNIAKWNGENWSALGSGTNGPVYALVANNDNLYVAGDFTRAGGKKADYIAKWDGENWTDLDFGLNGVVYTLAVMGSDLYAGGDFTIAGVISANRIAKWNLITGIWSALGPMMNNGMNNIVMDIAVMGTDLYAGGYFTTAGGISASRIAKWNGSTWSALGSGMSGTSSTSFTAHVRSLAVKGSDLYAGGKFLRAGGVTVNHIAKWNGSSWSALGSGISTGDPNMKFSIYVFSLTVIGNELFAGGWFGRAGGVSVSNIAKWNGSSWSALGSGFNFIVQTIKSAGDDLLVGGWFTASGVKNINHIARWDGETWFGVGNPGMGLIGTVYALAVMGKDLYVGGQFSIAGETNINRIAKWDGSDWSLLGSGLNDDVYALAVSGNNLFAGGRFTSAGGVSVNRIAKWDGLDWSPLASGFNNDVYAIAVSGNDLFAGGLFTSAGGVSVNRIAKWDGSKWSPLGSGVSGSWSGMSPSVRAIAVMGGDLFAGGKFYTAGGVTVNHIAKWDGSKWSALGSGVGLDNPNVKYNRYVYSLAVAVNDLYVGGSFNLVDGKKINGLAKWDGENWSSLGSGINGGVTSLVVIGNDLYVGGGFTTAEGIPVNSIAKWNGSMWSALGSGVNGAVLALTVTGNNLFFGGWFTTAGDKSSGRIARWFKPVAAAAVTRSFTTPQTEPLSFNDPDAITGVSIQIIDARGGPTVHVLRYDDPPANPVGIAQDVSPFRWIIQQSALAPFSNASIRFKLSDIPGHGITGSRSLYVYSRTTPGSGTFYMNSTSYDNETDEIVAVDVSEFGEFVLGNITVNLDEPGGIPVTYSLIQNYPNPFNPSTIIRYNLPEQSRVRLDVFNILGQHVSILYDGIREAGSHTTAFDATGLPGGVYICRMQAGGFTRTIKMLLVK